MKYSVYGAAALLLLSNGNLFCVENDIELLTVLFDTSFEESFDQSKTFIMSMVPGEKVLYENLAKIKGFIEKKAPSYKGAFDEINDAALLAIATVDQIYRDYVKTVDDEVVMLTYAQWENIKKSGEKKFALVQERLAKAKEKISKIKSFHKKSDVARLLNNMIEKFEMVKDKVTSEIEIQRGLAETQPFNAEQAFKKGEELSAIREERTGEEQWSALMNLIGFDPNFFSAPKFEEVKKKFSIGDDNVIYGGKGSVRLDLQSIYDKRKSE
jgi:hypothetical protein